MAYEAEISRANPTAFFFVVDQSYSMAGDLAGQAGSKSVKLAGVINRILNELGIRCDKGDETFNYFDISITGYGNDNYGATRVGSAFEGALAGRNIVPIGELVEYPSRIEERIQKADDGAGGLIDMKIEFPIWLEPIHSHDTPMNEAMNYTYQLVSDWVATHPGSFPPVVIHITDGDPRNIAESIRELSTDDGNVLMFSLHLSSMEGDSIIFPTSPNQLPNDYARLLYEMSSPLPSKWLAIAAETMQMNVKPGAHAFAYNADIVVMTHFLEIGTRQPTQMRN
jgi:hypothetical protein